MLRRAAGAACIQNRKGLLKTKDLEESNPQHPQKPHQTHQSGTYQAHDAMR